MITDRDAPPPPPDQTGVAHPPEDVRSLGRTVRWRGHSSDDSLPVRSMVVLSTSSLRKLFQNHQWYQNMRMLPEFTRFKVLLSLNISILSKNTNFSLTESNIKPQSVTCWGPRYTFVNPSNNTPTTRLTFLQRKRLKFCCYSFAINPMTCDFQVNDNDFQSRRSTSENSEQNM